MTGAVPVALSLPVRDSCDNLKKVIQADAGASRPTPVLGIVFTQRGGNHGKTRHGQTHLRAGTRLAQNAQGRIPGRDQSRRNRLAGSRLRLPAQGPAGGDVRSRRQLPGLLGHRHGQGGPRPEDRGRRCLHHRSARFGRDVVHARRQAAFGARQTRRAFGHRCGESLAGGAPGRSVQPSHRDDAASQW